MGRDILLGIDIGTTVLKVAAFGAESGETIAQVSVKLPVRVGTDGARETSAVAIDRALVSAGRTLASKLRTGWGRVAGIGLATQGGSILFADRATGRPLTPMILWNDSRGADCMPRLLGRRPVSFWRRRLLRDRPSPIMARMLWLKETAPQFFTDRNICVGAEGYAFFKLTGLWRQNPGHAIQIGCYNARLKGLDQRLYDLIGVPLSLVPPLRKAHETHPLSRQGAQLLALREGIPVAGPYHDQEAGYLSAAGASARPLQMSLGTAWVGNFSLPEGTKWRSPSQLVLAPLIGRGWFVVQPLATGNVAWDWALRQFVGRDHRQALRRAARIFAEELLPPEGLTALPWINAPNPLKPGTHGGGAFIGLSPRVGHADLLRAMAASMSFEMARIFRPALESKAIDGIVLGGGAAQGAFFQTLMAALFDPLPVRLAAEPDLAGARGSLYAFRGPASCGRTRRVGRPVARLRDRVERQFQQYLIVIRRLLGKEYLSAGLQIERKGVHR